MISLIKLSQQQCHSHDENEVQRFDIFTMVSIKNSIFWDVMPCSLVEMFRRNYELHL